MADRVHCPVCDAAYPLHVNFCGSCGTRLTSQCQACAYRNPANFRFCSNCGQPLAAGTVPAEVLRPAERRVVTILFADVKGFVSATTGRDPEEIAELVQRYFARLSQEVTGYGGTIDKYIGDAIMALFGAPASHENDPERAVLAAIRMQKALQDFSVSDLDVRSAPLRMRIGIATGEVLYCVIGSSAKQDYTVMGASVNLASRLESQAPVGGILVSEETYRLTRTLFEFEPEVQLRVKGLDEPVNAFRVVGRARVQASAASGRGWRDTSGDGRPRLVGRQPELHRLVSAFNAAALGAPQFVEIVGDAGIGKSRLIDELEASIGRAGRVVRGHSLPYEEAATFGLVKDFVRSLLSVPGAGNSGISRTVRTKSMSQTDWDLLARLMGTEVWSDADGYRSAEETNREMTRALADLVLQDAKRQTLVCVFEDVHWVDVASLNLIRQLLEQIERGTVMFVFLSRSGIKDAAQWDLKFGRTQIEVAPLSHSESLTLLESLLGPGMLPPNVADDLIKRADGVPYYLEELVRSLSDLGALERTERGWRYVKRVDMDAVPASLRAVLMARIDQLSAADRSLLQLASVVGTTFDVSLLDRVSAKSAEFSRQIVHLQQLDLIRPLDDRPGLFRFKHTLCQEVAYASLPRGQRLNLHRLVAATLGGDADEPDPEALETMVYHAFRGEQWERVVVLARQAAERAVRLYANRDAIALYERALEAIDAIERQQGSSAVAKSDPSSDRALQGDRARILSARADVQTLVGEFGPARDGLLAALRVCTDGAFRSGIFRRLGEIHERLGEFAAALQNFQAGLDELDLGPTEDEERGKILSSMSLVYYQQGELSRAAEAYERSLQVSGAQFDHRAVTRAFIELNRLGLPSAGEAHTVQVRAWQATLDQAETAHDLEKQAKALAHLGSLYARRRETLPAAEHLQRSVEALERIGDRGALAGTLVNLGIVQHIAGDFDRAAESLRRAIACMEQVGDKRGLARATTRLAALLQDQDRLSEAATQMENAVALVQGLGAKEHYPEYRRQLGELYLAFNDIGRALEQAELALGWSVQIGNRFEQASARKLFGRGLARLGRNDEARAQFLASIALFEHVGALADAEAVKNDLRTIGSER